MRTLRKILWGSWIVFTVAILVYLCVRPSKPSPTPEFTVTPSAPVLWITSSSGSGVSGIPTCSAIYDRSCDVAPPAYGPPTSIKVGTRLFRVYFREDRDMHGDWGESNYDREIILLNRAEPLESMRDTLLHELTHMAIRAGNQRAGLEDASEDEFIEASVPTQLLILQENPRLRKWLGL